MKQDDKKIQIRNSTVDFLVFTKDAHEEGIEVRVQNGTVWLTQKAISELFDIDRSVVNKHLKNIFESGELDENSTYAKFAQVADNGKTYQFQLMQNLHKLPTTVKPINISFTLYRQSSPLGIAPIPNGQLSSVNGRQKYLIPSPDRDMFLIKTV